MSRALLLSSLLVLGVGCAGAGSHRRAEGPEIRMGQDSDEPMLVTHTSAVGPTSSLSLREDGARGRFRNQPVSLTWDYQQVSGSVGTYPTRLELSEGDDTRVSGVFGGAPVDILLKDEVLLARVGPCSYFLKREEGLFTGKRNCSSPLEQQFTVDFPKSLEARPLGEMATLLTLTLLGYSSSNEAFLSTARFVSATERARHSPATSCRRIQ